MTKVIITDYFESDLTWEKEQYANLGVEFAAHDLKLGTPEQILRIAADADVIIVNFAKFTNQVIEGLQRCKLIIRCGIGYDNVDIATATRRNIAVSNNPDYCMNEVAEQTVMLIFACQRKLLQQNRILTGSPEDWTSRTQNLKPILRLSGKTVGVIGFGSIGSMVYRMLQGFGLRFLVYDPYLPNERGKQFDITLASFEQVLREADVITIHMPLTAETYHMFDEPQFQLMKRTAVLVNTSRGGIINLRALDQALRTGVIAHAGIDVYEEREPPDPDDPLLHNERAICTPHLSWLSEEALWKLRSNIVDDVRRFVQGQGPRCQVNREVQLFPPANPD